LAEKQNLFAAAFKPKKIFFPTKTADRLEEINQSIVQTATTFALTAGRRNQGLSLSEPSFKTPAKGKRYLNGALACSFGQIVRRRQILLSVDGDVRHLHAHPFTRRGNSRGRSPISCVHSENRPRRCR
jgi:hypothetical protein